MSITLSAAEARVLAVLVEKQISTPEYYPLSLNALTNACNQKTNRDPVVAYGDDLVQRALDSLREKQLARVIYDGSGRVPKHGHVMTTALRLDKKETALLCELMLRGPQTIGELRNRTGRLHQFDSLAEVEATLEELAQREETPLVVRLPRQPGCKEPRYAHLLCGAPKIDPAAMMGEAHHPTPVAPASAVAAAASAPPPADDRVARLEEEIESLRAEIEALKARFQEFVKQFE